MREIKFRLFYKDYGDPKKPHGTMFYDVIPCTSDFKTWLIAFENDKRYDGDFVVGEDLAEPMQFTGLRDKNGKEIYEGDVIRFTYFATVGDEGSVVYLGTAFCYQTDSHWNACNIDMLAGEGEIEVIGNVHENPELLK